MSTVDAPTALGWQDFQAIGLNHRRFIYWSRVSYLRPINDSDRGSGNPLRFDPSELDVARWMLALTTWGMELTAAADYARDPWLRKNLAQILLSESLTSPAVVSTPPESAPTSSAQGDEGGAESPTSAPPATPH